MNPPASPPPSGVNPNAVPYRQLPDGSRMPAIGLGTFGSDHVPPHAIAEAVIGAAEVGYRHFDCASVYGNEPDVGRALRTVLSSGVARQSLWITSKLWNDMHNPADVEEACRKTLVDLELDYLDLYLIHWPVALKKGVFIPASGKEMITLEELPLSSTWAAMEKLVDKDLVRHIGVSNFSVAKLRDLKETGKIRSSRSAR